MPVVPPAGGVSGQLLLQRVCCVLDVPAIAHDGELGPLRSHLVAGRCRRLVAQPDQQLQPRPRIGVDREAQVRFGERQPTGGGVLVPGVSASSSTGDGKTMTCHWRGYWVRTCTSPMVMWVVLVKVSGMVPVCPMPDHRTVQYEVAVTA